MGAKQMGAFREHIWQCQQCQLYSYILLDRIWKVTHSVGSSFVLYAIQKGYQSELSIFENKYFNEG